MYTKKKYFYWFYFIIIILIQISFIVVFRLNYNPAFQNIILQFKNPNNIPNIKTDDLNNNYFVAYSKVVKDNDISLFFTTSNYFNATAFSCIKGDFYNDKIYADTVVLNKNSAFEKFGSYDIIGLPIELDNKIYKIIGIADDNTSYQNAYTYTNTFHLKTIDEAIIRQKFEQNPTFLQQSKKFFSKEYLNYFLNFRIADVQAIFSIKDLNQIYDIRLFYQSIYLVFFLNTTMIFFNIVILLLMKQIAKLKIVFLNVMIFLKQSYINELFRHSLSINILIESVKFLFIFIIFTLIGSKIIEFFIMYYNFMKDGYFLIFLRSNIAIIITLSSFYVIQTFILFVIIYFTFSFFRFYNKDWLNN